MTLPFTYDAFHATRRFCREARAAGVSPAELYARRRRDHLLRLATLTHEERRAEVLAALRSWRSPVTRECFWPQLHAALDELVAEGRVRTRTTYEVVEDGDA